MSEARDANAADSSVHVDIIQATPRGSSTGGSPDLTIWEPNFVDSDESHGHGNISPGSNSTNTEAPEKELTLFALRIAVMEQLASGLGTLAFVWATVVLLGGFAIALSRQDFWIVTIILVIEGARIYGRRTEIEWQHQSTWSFVDGVSKGGTKALRRLTTFFNPRATIQGGNETDGQDHRTQLRSRFGSSRTWNFREIPLISFWGRVFLLKNIGEGLIWLQVSFAVGSMALSLFQLVTQNFGKLPDSELKNRNTALNLFYSLAFANDALFLVEKLYWYWKIHRAKLLESVSEKCGFKSSRPATDLIKRFFYDVYSVCINDSIFSGLKKDLVSYGEKLLESGEPDKNLMGAQILMRFVDHPQFAFDTIRKIGTSGKTMERLVEMLSWKNGSDKEIRKLAAQIVSRISGKRKGSIRIAKIPGSLEAIASLLHAEKNSDNNNELPECSTFNLLGMLILRNLAGNHQNCEKISKSPGLISKIIEFTSASPDLLIDEHPADTEVRLLRRALQVVLLMASSKGDTGNALREQISKNVFFAGHVRQILKHGKSHMVLQKTSIKILTCLAMDEKATDRIAGTGGVIKLLLEIFFQPGVSEDTSVSNEAGEALAMLTLKSQKSCDMILRECSVVAKMVEMLSENLQRLNACKILRNICVFATRLSSGCLDVVVENAVPIVLRRAIENNNKKLLEASIGLLVGAGKFMEPAKFEEGLKKADINLLIFVNKLTDILTGYTHPDIEVPRLRRYVIELFIWMMEALHEHLEIFKSFGIREILESVAETTTELENFHLFSGSVGLCQHESTVAALVEKAQQLLQQGSSSQP